MSFCCAEDRFSWLRDEEMGRQAVAGVNPLQIELVKVCGFAMFCYMNIVLSAIK